MRRRTASSPECPRADDPGGAPAAGQTGAGGRRSGALYTEMLRGASPLLVLLLVAGLFQALAPERPLSLLDIRTIAVHTVIVGTAALGMTLVIISGGLDLSVGSGVALCGVSAAIVANRGGGPMAALATALAMGAACGLYNGLLITLLRLPPFIATLGTLGLFRGVAKWISQSKPVSADPGFFHSWVQPVPPPQVRGWIPLAPGVWLMLALAALLAGTLRCTVFGRRVVAIGSNEDAARRCGVPVRQTKTLVYMTAGLFVGLAGLFQFARLTQGDPTASAGLELEVIAAVVIGGASLSGGQASIAGTLAGAALMALLKNRGAALSWPNFVQEIIAGHIIIAAVALDQWRRRRGRG
jgi:ribose transport system permease protein